MTKPVYKPGAKALTATALMTIAATVVDAHDRHGSRRMTREETTELTTTFYRRNTAERLTAAHRAPPGQNAAVAALSEVIVLPEPDESRG